jgi:sigma-B regulation protein RsbU (phosphoserine phosphatase)
VNPASAGLADNGVGENLLECLQRIRQYEIEEARRLHLAMIPAEPLRTHAVELVAKIRPVSEVGGDFLDYFQIPDGRIGFYVGDVVGKGLPAALYAALTIGTLRGFNKHMETPCSLLAHLNQRLRVHNLAGRYCAVQYGLFEPATRCLEFSNAALPLPLCISKAGPQWLGQGGLPSGLLDGASYEKCAIELGAGESVIFYTDGICEAGTADGEEFGCDRVAAVLARNRELSAEEQLDRLFEAVDDFVADAPQHDDMTALILKTT